MVLIIVLLVPVAELQEDPFWSEAALRVLCGFERPGAPRALTVEAVNFIGWLLEMQLRPPRGFQMRTMMLRWQHSLRCRWLPYRVPHAIALAVFGLTC